MDAVINKETTVAVLERQLTLKKFLKLPEEKPALEFMHGVVTQKAMPKAKHGALQVILAQLINEFARPRRLAFAFSELRATFASASVVPDISVFHWLRIGRDAKGEPLDDVFEPPDIAIEIASPGQRVARLVERCGWYVNNGVRIALMVNPRDHSVTLFRPDETPLTLLGDVAIDLSEVIPGFQLTVKTLFDALILA